MPAKVLDSADLRLPRFEPVAPSDGNAFGFSSHRGARDAILFGLSIHEPGFNVFVVGQDRSGRMTATLELLRAEMQARPPVDDWIYLNNFRHPHRPRPYALPAGAGRRFCRRMAALIPKLREALRTAFGREESQSLLQAGSEALRSEAARRLEAIREEARKAGLEVVQTQAGLSITPLGGELPAEPARRREGEAAAQRIAAALADVQRWIAAQQLEAAKGAEETARQIADAAVAPCFHELMTEFGGYPAVGRWLIQAQADVLDGLARFQAELPPGMEPPERRYAVNLMVDRGERVSPEVVLEPNPTYENLFGRIEYHQQQGALETDFSLLRAGALHRANGGVLVLRAEAIAAEPMAWTFLKGALRDREIRIEEPLRQTAVPIAGAPRPKPIPLDVKVVIVGHPKWFHAFFDLDPDFRTHFRVKAEIDPEMPASGANVDVYAGIIRRMMDGQPDLEIEPEGVVRLIGLAAETAGDRERLSCAFETIQDTIKEAAALARAAHARHIDRARVQAAIDARRARNGKPEARVQEAIRRGLQLIDTHGAVVGQVNGLVVRDLGDHVFGAPARVTARAAVGRRGVVNIERDVAMGGPIQQKAAMIIQGFLAGRFARRRPLSFTCTITFEQSYGGVEGDSASLAEIVAVLSDLSGIPARQDIAITGSVNQRGQAQAVGGVAHKVAGFYRTCRDAPRGLTGTQGVVIPASNETHMILDDEIVEAVAAGRFHVWSVEHVDEAAALILATRPGEPDEDANYPAGSIYAKVEAQLEAFDRALDEDRGC